MTDTDGQRYCDCCGVLLTIANNSFGYEICDECDKRLEEDFNKRADERIEEIANGKR